MKNILPSAVYLSINNNLNWERLQEVRLRAGMPVAVSYGSRKGYLSVSGITNESQSAVYVTSCDIKECVIRAAEHSIYAYDENIKQGYITLKGGVRLGVIGEVITEGGKVLTLKNYSSINIRFPHEIKGISMSIMSDIVLNKCRIIIISPPGAGKTTMLRDIAKNLSSEKYMKNVLIVDERGELAAVHNGAPEMDVGHNSDIITGANKSHAFECAIRGMNPDVIITDELFGMSDFEIVCNAVGCGVGVIASVHSDNASDFISRKFCKAMVETKLFERYYFLSDSFTGNRITEVRDKNFECVNV